MGGKARQRKKKKVLWLPTLDVARAATALGEAGEGS